MAFDYQLHGTTSPVPTVDFSSYPEMRPYLTEPKAMYVGAPGKNGYLRMGFEIDPRGKSIMRDLERRVPIVVQQELYFDEEMPGMPCVYILSSGGQYMEGDRYRQDITMRKGSYAFVSTGAANKVAEMRETIAASCRISCWRRIHIWSSFPNLPYPAGIPVSYPTPVL